MEKCTSIIKKQYKKCKILVQNLLKKTDSILNIYKDKECLINSKISAFLRCFWIEKNLENLEDAQKLLNQAYQINELYRRVNSRYLFKRNVINISFALVKKKLNFIQEAKQILLRTLDDINTSKSQYNEESLYLTHRACNFNALDDCYFKLFQNDSVYHLLDSAALYYDLAFQDTKKFKPVHKHSEILYNFKKTNVFNCKKSISQSPIQCIQISNYE